MEVEVILSLHAVSTGILEQGRRFAHAFAEYCLYTFGIEEEKLGRSLVQF